MKSFDTSLLYVLSGTGNTHRVACWIRNSFNKKRIKTCLKSIEDANFKKDFQNSEKQLISVLFPTHGFMPPWSMIKFLFKMPNQKKVPAIVVATRGAIWIGPVKIPGAAGFATFFAALVLLFKGYDIRGIFSLDMAANMNNLHPSLTHDTIKRISSKSKAKLEALLSFLMSEKRILFTLNNLYEGIWTCLLFWFIPIFPILYLIYGKTTMAKIMFANNRCVSCGRCARFCPNNAIEMKSFMGKKRPFWTYHCENCMRCMGYCKKKAVEAGHSWAFLQYFIVTIPVIKMITSWLMENTGFTFEIQNYWVAILFETIYFLPAIFLSYWIFWLLLRVPLINSIFSVTTLTHYFTRFHDPETRLKDLVKGKKN
ncbi:MAG: EFR1 family ferrodoxin [Desulfobacula sp.]|nr:EFR1 family ferrodoxin [Desulfobacula sp.]